MTLTTNSEEEIATQRGNCDIKRGVHNANDIIRNSNYSYRWSFRLFVPNVSHIATRIRTTVQRERVKIDERSGGGGGGNQVGPFPCKYSRREKKVFFDRVAWTRHPRRILAFIVRPGRARQRQRCTEVERRNKWELKILRRR